MTLNEIAPLLTISATGIVAYDLIPNMAVNGDFQNGMGIAIHTIPGEGQHW